MSAHGNASTALDRIRKHIGGSASPPTPWLICLENDLEIICATRCTSDDAVQAILDEAPIVVRGRRCRTCGHGEVTVPGLDAYGAARVVRNEIVRALAADGAEWFVAQVLAETHSGAEQAGSAMREALVRRDIVITGDGVSFETCPCCDGDDVVDYRWKLDDAGLVAPGTGVPLKDAG